MPFDLLHPKDKKISVQQLKRKYYPFLFLGTNTILGLTDCK